MPASSLLPDAGSVNFASELSEQLFALSARPAEAHLFAVEFAGWAGMTGRCVDAMAALGWLVTSAASYTGRKEEREKASAGS